MSDQPWKYQKDPVQEMWRLTRGDELIGVIRLEVDAKRICEAVNAQGAPQTSM